MARPFGDFARHWEQLDVPLRPCAEDLAAFSAAVRRWTGNGAAPRSLMLGVTPELYRMAWPEGTRVAAVDHSRAMIDAVWPGRRGSAVCGDWTTLPLPARSRDVVVCDGGISMVAYPHDSRRMAEELKRIVAPGGLFVVRLYTPSDQRETVSKVQAALLAGRIANQSLLKVRLWMSLAADVSAGVRLSDVWDAIHEVAPDLRKLARRIGWRVEQLPLIDAYRGCAKRYYFPNIEQVHSLYRGSPGGFQLEAVISPSYELGEHCPLVIFRRVKGDFRGP